MADAAIEGAEPISIEIEGSTISASRLGSGPPLLLLHGFPQTRAMWAKIAAQLSQTHAVIAADLPGYGESAPPSGPEGATKRVFARRMVGFMAALGHERFDIAGHDRGGRVAYRMALDHPESVARLAVLDILPTSEYWTRMDRGFALKIYHWAFLAQPFPFPETLIGAAPDYFLEEKLKSWTASKTLDCFAPAALETYRQNVRDPARLKAMCDDYRAGAGADVEHDLDDRRSGRKIAASTLVLWGNAGIAQSAETPLDVWQDWCDDLRGAPIPSGHFLPEEAPGETLAAMRSFFT